MAAANVGDLDHGPGLDLVGPAAPSSRFGALVGMLGEIDQQLREHRRRVRFVAAGTGEFVEQDLTAKT